MYGLALYKTRFVIGQEIKSHCGPGGGRGTRKSIELTPTYGSMMFLYHLITLAENIGKAVLATAARNNLAYLEHLTPLLFPVCHERTTHPFLQHTFGRCLHRHNLNHIVLGEQSCDSNFVSRTNFDVMNTMGQAVFDLNCKESMLSSIHRLQYIHLLF